MLLHDTILKDDSYKTGTSSPICDCGSGERETTEHFLLRCSNYAETRKAMFDRIGALCLFSHHQFHANVNEHLLWLNLRSTPPPQIASNVTCRPTDRMSFAPGSR